jgi:type IX secretion system PorP/SprF family membrane protein
MDLFIPPSSPSDTGYMLRSNLNSLTADFGVYINYIKLNVGLSIIQLNGNQLWNSSKLIFERAHFYGFINYTFGKETGIQIQPNFLVKSDFIFKELNFNLLLKYKSKLMLGAGIQSRDSFSFFAGYDFYKKYRLAYSYDMTFSQLNNKLGGTHELCLAFLLK